MELVNNWVHTYVEVARVPVLWVIIVVVGDLVCYTVRLTSMWLCSMHKEAHTY